MSDNTIEIRNYNLSIKTASTEIRLLADINTKIISGKVTAITGPSGAGKSLLSSAVMQLLDRAGGYLQSGEILLGNQTIFGEGALAPEKWRGSRISMIFQNPASAFNPVKRCTDQILEAWNIYHHDNAAEGNMQLDYWLKKLNLNHVPHIYQAYPHQLSGGQLQRLMFIMAVINQPVCIIADEPTTALDIWHTAEQLKLWKSVCMEHQITLILITHDLSLVRQLADDVIFLKDGKLLFQAGNQEFFEYASHPEVRRFTEDYFYFEAHSRPKVSKDKQTEVCLMADQICKSYPDHSRWLKPGYTEILSEITFTLQQGVTLGITGPSGSGKTTLLFCLLKLIKADTGRLFWKSMDVSEIPENILRQKRNKFQIVFQDAYRSMPYFMTVRQIMEEACRAAGKAVLNESINETLDKVQLRRSVVHQHAGSLSGGELQRLSLARTLIMLPDLIILDEPFSAMDPTLQRQMVKLILEYQREQNCAFILVSHDLTLIKYLADDLLVLESGKMTDFGRVEDVISNPSDSLKKLLQAYKS